MAQWLGVSLSRLRWYSHDKAADTVWHYLRYTIPKRSGGERVILAPKTELKTLQRKLLDDLLTHIPVSESAHGFVTGRSIVSNAQPHVGKAVVLNLDLKDFFPSVSFARVRGLFIAWGYSFSVASALALLCTERDRVSFERSNQNYWVSVGPRALIQGAPTEFGAGEFIRLAIGSSAERVSDQTRIRLYALRRRSDFFRAEHQQRAAHFSSRTADRCGGRVRAQCRKNTPATRRESSNGDRGGRQR